MRKRLFTRVDFPNPDSPKNTQNAVVNDKDEHEVSDKYSDDFRQTCHHQSEVKALLHRLPVDLIRKRSEANILLVLKETSQNINVLYNLLAF